MSDFQGYANSFQAHPRLGLERMQDMMARLGNPQESLNCIHIAGTNGKGSVAAFLDGILCHAGKRVGKYTSPNLVRVNERITVNGTPISDQELTPLLGEMEKIAHATKEALGEIPSQFEVWTAAAFTYFARMACDIVILEVGMGGAYDATNVITRPYLCVLTGIDLDHTTYLGNTTEEIARTKCGILKEGCVTHTLVSAPQSEAVKGVILEEAEKKGCRVIFADPPPAKRHYGMQEAFYFPGYGDIRSGLAGIHQIENAFVALECAKVMGVDIYDAQCGVTYAKHPARMEVLSKDPLMVYDGGHNPHGIRALLASLDRYWGTNTPRVCIFACMADKEVLPSLKMLSERPTKFVFTTVQNNPRAMGAEELLRLAEGGGIHGTALPTLADAVAYAKGLGLPTLICGSLYLYADLPKGMGTSI